MHSAVGACAPDGAHAGLAACEVNQRAGGLGSVSPPCARGHDAIGDLHHPVGIGLTLESRAADDLPAGLLDDEEAVTPGIRAPALPRDMAQGREPLRRDLPRYVEPPQSIRGGERSDLLELVRRSEEHT